LVVDASTSTSHSASASPLGNVVSTLTDSGLAGAAPAVTNVALDGKGAGPRETHLY